MAYSYASERLRDDEKFFAKAVKSSDGTVIQHASGRIRNNKKCATLAIKSSWTAYNALGDELKADKDLLMLALDNNNNIFSNDTPLATCDAKFTSDKEIVKKAIQNWAYAIQFAGENLKDDKELVLIAVSEIGGALEYASERLRNDREVVLKAISMDSDAIDYASEKLKKDKEILKVSGR
jgi:hypothetical protein